MNYQKHYDALVERAKCRVISGYTERHHVVPKCLGGSDEESNLVSLTAEEHFLAHKLLVKIYPNNRKLILAAVFMAVSPINARVNNKIYSWLKNRFSQAQSVAFKGKTWTAAQNKARSDKVKAQWADPEFKVKRAAAMRGRRWSEQSRLAKSMAMRGKSGRVWTAEQKAKLSESKRRQHLLKGAVANER